MTSTILLYIYVKHLHLLFFTLGALKNALFVYMANMYFKIDYGFLFIVIVKTHMELIQNSVDVFTLCMLLFAGLLYIKFDLRIIFIITSRKRVQG